MPPPHRPHRPWEPEPRRPAPIPILPTWEERDDALREGELADRLLRMRIVHLGGRLDTALANRGMSQLLILARQPDRPIELHLSCSDSDLDASLALADTVEVIAAPVHVIVHGALSGPAVAVLCAGQERGAHRAATFVLSAPRATALGTADQLAVRAEQHERQTARLRDIIARTTGRTDEEIDNDLRRGRVLSAEEALEYGLLNRLL